MSEQYRLLKIYVGEATKHKGKNSVQLILNLLREHEIAGVTVIRGIMGYGADKKMHGTRVLELSADLPVVLEMIDTAKKIEQVLPKLVEMIPKGLCFSVDVDVRFGGVLTRKEG